jgi:hypothetical protein
MRHLAHIFETDARHVEAPWIKTFLSKLQARNHTELSDLACKRELKRLHLYSHTSSPQQYLCIYASRQSHSSLNCRKSCALTRGVLLAIADDIFSVTCRKSPDCNPIRLAAAAIFKPTWIVKPWPSWTTQAKFSANLLVSGPRPSGASSCRKRCAIATRTPERSHHLNSNPRRRDWLAATSAKA